MKKHEILVTAAIGFLLSGSAAVAADINGFRSARFGATEKAVIEAAVTDLKIKSSDIQRSVDPATKVTALSAKLSSFAPLDLPATVAYVMGYKCNCLTRVVLSWEFPEKATVEQRKTAMVGIAALVDRFTSDTWGKEETVTNRVTGEVKEGSSNIIVFFRGQNKNGSAVTLTGAPVKMEKTAKEEKKDNALSANIDDLKAVSLIYEKSADNPDIFRIDVTGF
ncbi:MAG: hypothetical protein WC464_02095 [Bdellovibrionales bacterium]